MRNLLIFTYVDAFARTGSIRKAADQLSITLGLFDPARQRLRRATDLGCNRLDASLLQGVLAGMNCLMGAGNIAHKI